MQTFQTTAVFLIPDFQPFCPVQTLQNAAAKIRHKPLLTQAFSQTAEDPGWRTCEGHLTAYQL